jgi:hypothetical protein
MADLEFFVYRLHDVLNVMREIGAELTVLTDFISTVQHVLPGESDPSFI